MKGCLRALFWGALLMRASGAPLPLPRGGVCIARLQTPPLPLLRFACFACRARWAPRASSAWRIWCTRCAALRCGWRRILGGNRIPCPAALLPALQRSPLVGGPLPPSFLPARLAAHLPSGRRRTPLPPLPPRAALTYCPPRRPPRPQIYTAGPAFKEANNFLWPFKLSSAKGGLDKKRLHYIEGGQAGNREGYINNLVRRGAALRWACWACCAVLGMLWRRCGSVVAPLCSTVTPLRYGAASVRCALTGQGAGPRCARSDAWAGHAWQSRGSGSEGRL